MGPIPIPEPNAGLIINGVKTTGTGLWKLWEAYGEHKEAGELLRGALASAICDPRREAPEVQKLAADLEIALRQTGIPQHTKPKFFARVKAFPRKLLPGKGFRQLPAMRAFGPSFAEHLSGWLLETTRSTPFAERLEEIECEEERTLEALASRFPEAFEAELLDETQASGFREQLLSELLLTDYVRGEIARRRERLSARRAAARVTTTGAVPGGIAYTAADLLGANDPRAALIGAGAAALGAFVGALGARREQSPSAEQREARRMVLDWVAHLLQRLTDEPTGTDPDALRVALYAALREIHADPHRAGHLPEAAAEVSSLREIVSTTGDELLDHELAELQLALEEAGDDPRLGPQALARLRGVIVACDLPPPKTG